MKTAIFMESTGVYHLTLFHFLRNTFETCILNPLITNCNKNGDIRKVKNDKKDALTIAKIGKFQNVKYTSAFDIEIYTLKALCRDYYKFTDSKSAFKKNVQLIYSIPGVGELTAITIMSEIDDINGFVKAKHLVAYFGIDPSVNQSGKFNSDRNTMSKRGTRIGTKALYAIALASIHTSRNGEPINKVLLTYYKENLNGRSKKSWFSSNNA